MCDSITAPVGIIGAMDVEVRQFVCAMTGCREETIAATTYYIGRLSSVPCVVAKCGVGKVNAAVCAQTMILRFAPRCVINLGVAGGIGRDVKIGDLVIASACVQYDFDTTAFGDPLGFLSIGSENCVEIPCDPAIAQQMKQVAGEIYGHAHIGVVATGDRFVADPDVCEGLRQQFAAKACEMEGGSIAHVCKLNGVPVAVLRAISDNADDDGTMDFAEFASVSAEKSQALMAAVLPGLVDSLS